MRDAFRSTSRLIIGLTVLTLGVLFTLDSFGIVDAHAALRWWPAVLVVYGVTRIAGLGCHPAPISGSLIVLVGSWLLFHNLGYINRSVWELWPVFLIVWGLAIISGRGRYFGMRYRRGRGWRMYDRYPDDADVTVGVGRRRPEPGGESGAASGPEYGAPGGGPGATGAGSSGGYAGSTGPRETHFFGGRGAMYEDSSPTFSTLAFMGSVARKVVTQEFRGGDIAAVMGGGDIDLRSAKMANGTARVEVNLIMGGVNLFVPEDWSVEFQGMPIMGSVEDRSKRPIDSSKGRLLITGVVLMSSVIIRN